ncbi:hypothetical protein [Streptomyces sp. NPDC059631]|uniref:hypothetical protein n=1 Tax=unclassified Streptomyces TaxID=2593676 RepID=UPI0036BDB177
MAIVSTCMYGSGEKLICPDVLDISRAKIRLDLDTGEKPTFDRGHTHVFVVSGMGIVAEQARERVHLRLRRFFDRAEVVHGSRKITKGKPEQEPAQPQHHDFLRDARRRRSGRAIP